MKLKGINPFEQHVEKIIMGVCGTAFIGALGWQFLMNESEVKVGNATLPAARAFDPAQREAESKRQRIDMEKPELPPLPKIDLAGSLNVGREARLPAVAGTTIALGGKPGIGKTNSPGAEPPTQFPLPRPAAPTGEYALAFRSTISPVERLRTPELAAILPAEQPFDKAAVSIEGEFNGKALMATLSADPDGDGPLAPVPNNWIRDGAVGMVEIIGVEVERKTVRKPDGSTPGSDEVVKVGAMPGTLAGADYWKANVQSAGHVPPTLDEIRAAHEQVLRPPYLDTIAGVEWAPPREMEKEFAAGAAGNPKDLQIAALTRDLKRLDRRIALAGGKKQGPAQRRDEGGAGGPGRSGPGRQSGPGRTGEGEPASNSDEQAAQTRAKNLERMFAQRDVLVKKLKDLGKVEAGATADVDANAPAVHMLDNDKVKLWAHDLTVEAGAVYQYRMRVVINNPLFDRALQSTQAELAKLQVIEGDWSEWTTPVDVGRDRYFFITNAESRDGVTGRPRASAEMFVFYYGYYRNGSASVTPGDVMNAQATLPKLRMADPDALQAAFANPQGIDPALMDPVVREATAEPAPGQGVRPGANRDQVAAVPNPIMTVPAPEEIPLPVDAILLDVVTALGQTGGGQPRFDVTFRDQTGSLVTVSPDRDRSRPEYKLVEASAKLGRDQDKVPAPEKEEAPLPIPEPKTRPKPTGGGGGGGG